MECGACHAPLLEGAKFCTGCGAPVPILCAACGSSNPRTARFCAQCGTDLTTAFSVPAIVERRHISVLFCDLVGSTALSSRLDPEDLRILIRGFQQRVAEVMSRFGGFVARYLGDGVLVYFGWPRASEADAEQALRAALAAAKAVVTAPIADEILNVRIGIATGLVVVGDVIDAGEGPEQTAVGETPNRAARLQTLAEAGGIVIDAATRRLVGELFDVRLIGRVTLKGLPEPIEAFELRDEHVGESRFEALRATCLTPLIGRHEELDLLLRRWHQTCEGQGRVVLIAGEAGIGKSRLLAELEKQLSGQAFREMRLFCLPHTLNAPLYPVIRYIGQDAGFKRDNSPTERAKKLRARLEAADASSDDIALITALLRLPGDGLPSHNLSPQRRKELTFAALLRRVERICAMRPALILLEDMHWADPSTRELLDDLIRRVAELRILLVMTFRPEFTSPWTGHAGVTSLTLSRLERHESVMLARQLTTRLDLPGRLFDQIIMQSDGVPLFIEELTKTVLECSYQSSLETFQTPVPPTLQASLIARLDRMPGARQIAQIGSVFGREFRRLLLGKVTHLPASTIDEGLDQLVAAGLLFRRGEGIEATYTFKHALVQEAAYESLLRVRRASLHAAIGTVLESVSDLAATRPGLLGYHFALAGDAERGSFYLLRAGELLVTNSAMSEAETRIREGLALATDIMSPVERARREAELTLTLGNVRLAVQGIGSPAHRATFAHAAELCRTLDRKDAGAARLLARALFGQWSCELQAGDLEQSLQAGLELYDAGRTSPDPELRAAAGGHAVSYMFLGRLDEAIAVFADAIADSEIRTYRPAQKDFGFDTSCHLYAQYARSLALTGMLDQSRTHLQFALDRAHSLQHLPTMALTMMIACTTSWIARDIEALRCWSGELVRMASEQGYVLWHARGLSYAGWLRAAEGEPEEGLAMLDRALLQFEEMEVALSGPHTRAMRADVHSRMRRVDLADAELDQALAICARTRETWPEAELHRRKGDLRRADPNAAEAHFRRAMSVAQTQGAKLFELRSVANLARLWRESGLEEPIADLLAPVYGRFSEGFEASDLVEARALLRLASG
jgi:class 3 adenylate cyclase/tetratricopeptide (TPR) repeat protein/ABC-type transport system involved in cytochrome c biogenesis ATPase subunit